MQSYDKIVSTDQLASELEDYWNKRSDSYSVYSREELEGPRYEAWCDRFRPVVNKLQSQVMPGQMVKALDVGTGPGFFSIILARMGCSVDALDQSPDMIEESKRNAAFAKCPQTIAYHQGTATQLPFQDDTFDLVVMRNLSWMMTDLRAAYVEWLRVLRPGGTLMLFDGAWYRYLADPAVDAIRHADQDGYVVEDWSYGSQASSDQEKRCEELASNISTTYLIRPGWDLMTLNDLGVANVIIDPEAWKTLYTESEQRFYHYSPFFMICVEK